MKPPASTIITSYALAELIPTWMTIPILSRKARQIHALVLTTATPFSSPFLNNNVISMYAKCGFLYDALNVFATMPARNIVSYNAAISAFSKTPVHAHMAFRMVSKMNQVDYRPNAATFASLLTASCLLRDQLAGAAVHSQVVSSGCMDDRGVQTTLLCVYSVCGDLVSANKVFADMPHKDAIAWNAIIHGNLKKGSSRLGLQLFYTMVNSGVAPTEHTFSAALNACRRLTDQCSGEMIHAQIIKSEYLVDVTVHNALSFMYSSCGDVAASFAVFQEIDNPHLVSWNSLIAGYADNGNAINAMESFVRFLSISSKDMRPDDYTYSAVISATESFPAMHYGKPLHAHIEKLGLGCSVFVCSTLINMYFHNQESGDAQRIFHFLHTRDPIVWTAMIVGLSRLGEGEASMQHFYNMIMEGHKVDHFSLSIALNYCADAAVLKQGEMVHSLAIQTGYELDIYVCSSLIDMYVKNGTLEFARMVFVRVQNPDLKCWNAMLGGYGNHGNDQEAFELLDQILEQGLRPDHVTFLSLLSACTHRGLLERGRLYWDFMMEEGLVPGPKHYACMVNLLCRAGLLEDAEELILMSPFADSFPEIWRILLNFCVVFKNVRIGIRAARHILAMSPDDIPTYTLLSNLYASAGRWQDMAETRRRMRELMLDKDPGLSWIEIKDQIHKFSADDENHKQVEEAKTELERVIWNLKEWATPEFLMMQKDVERNLVLFEISVG